MRAQAIEFWSRLNRSQRITIAVGALLFLLGFVFILMWTLHPEEEVLFRDLTLEDAGEITSQLDAGGMKYRLDKGGTAIYVPKKEANKTRLALAQKGLPRKSASLPLDSFKPEFTDSDKVIEQKQRLYLEAKIAKNIEALEQVEEARVNLAFPKEELYSEKEQDRTASVYVKLRPGMELKDVEVSGIVHLVAKAVPGLKNENVTVIDNRGQVLSEGDDEKAGAGVVSKKRFEMEKRLATIIQNKLQTLLDVAYGNGNTISRVTCELDFDKKYKESEIYKHMGPGGRDVYVSRKRDNENFKGPNLRPGGVTGANPNIPGYPMLAPEGPAEYKKTGVIDNLQPSKFYQKEEPMLGALKRMTVAVMLDTEIFKAPEERRKFESDRDDVKQIVQAASGFKEGRDELKVKYVAFLNPDRRKEAPRATTWLDLLPLLIPAAMAFVLTLILLAIILRRPPRPRPVRIPALPASGLPPMVPVAMGATGVPLAAAAAAGALDEKEKKRDLPPLQVTPGKSFIQVVKEREEIDSSTITDFEQTVGKETDSVAKLIRTWMQER